MEKEPKRPAPINSSRRPEILSSAVSAATQLPESPRGPMEFLSRSWSLSALEVSKALQAAKPSASNKYPTTTSIITSSSSCTNTSTTASIPEDVNAETEELAIENGNDRNVSSNINQFSFAASATSQLVLERIMSQSEMSPLTSGRLSHSSGPLNGGGSLTETDSPPVSPSEEFDDIVKYFRTHNTIQPLFAATTNSRMGTTNGASTPVSGGPRTVGRWLKDRKEKKKEETRAHNAQLHAAVSVAAVASAVAAIAAATAASSSGKNEQAAKVDMAVASAASLVAAQCVEAAENLGAEREHLASVVSSAVNVKSHDDIVTLTAAAATALRGAATLKARALKEVWNIATALPAEKATSAGLCGQINTKHSDSSFSGELPVTGEDYLGACNQELLAKGTELLKRTRKGDLHWKIVSVYINRIGQVMLKMKSKHVGGTFTKKKKNLVLEVKKDIPAWPGRNLFDSGEQRCYFGLKTETRRVVEFECRNQREYDTWTQGISRLLSMATEQKQTSDVSNGWRT